MKKTEFIDLVAQKTETTRATAARFVEAIFDTTSGAIADAVRAGSHVSIPGFGKFRTKKRAARTGRNPKTGAEIQIPERTVVAFTPGRGLQETIAGDAKPKRAAKAASGTGAPAAKKTTRAARGAAKK